MSQMQIDREPGPIHAIWYAYLPVSGLVSLRITAPTGYIAPVKTTLIAGFGFDRALFLALHCVDSSEHFGARDLGMHIESPCAPHR